MMRTVRRLLAIMLAASLPLGALAGPSLNEDAHVQTLRGVDAAHVWIAGIDREAVSIGLTGAPRRMVVETALA